MSEYTWLKKAAALSILPITVLGLAGCSTSGPEEGVDVEDVVEEDVVEDGGDAGAVGGRYDGLYDQTFYDDSDSYVGEEVTLSADVNEVIDPTSFTIAGTDDTTVDALLIFHADPAPGVVDELTVRVTGTVMDAFDLLTVEDEMGIDLDDELYEDWDGERYLDASTIDTSVAADN